MWKIRFIFNCRPTLKFACALALNLVAFVEVDVATEVAMVGMLPMTILQLLTSNTGKWNRESDS